MIDFTVCDNVVYMKADEGFYLDSILKNNLSVFKEELIAPRGGGRYKKVHTRVPLYITLSRKDHEYLFPRGLYNLIESQLKKYGDDVEIDDQSHDDFGLSIDEISKIDIPNILKPEASFTLRDDQVLAVRKSLYYKRGVVQLPTGCFTGDTKIRLWNGSIKSFQHLVRDGVSDLDVVSVDKDGKEVCGKAHNPHITKYVDELVEVTFDSNYKVRCTPDHRFMLYDGSYVPAEKLQYGDFLMSSHSARDESKGLSGYIVIGVKDIKLDKSVPVYDMEVDDYHNFSIVSSDSMGVIVHNSGKTEVMSAIIKILLSKYPDIKILVIEPTDVLVNKTTDRFNEYNLNAVRYKDIRNTYADEYNVLVSHPTALLYDSVKNSDLPRKIMGVFWDECQHCKCDTWKSLNVQLANCRYALGFSALAVSKKHLYETSVRSLSFDEALIVGATGPVIVNVPPKYYIDNNILATPVVVQLRNTVSGGFSKSRDWSTLRKYGIESEQRTALTTQAVAMFTKYGRRILILVGTKKQADDIVKSLATNYGLSDRIGVAFGAGLSYTVSPGGEKVKYDGEDILKDFDNEDFSILVSTSHMDEGVDLSNLDVAILASGGKKDRRIVQRIGRALRNNKTGNYAYIVDFYDEGSNVLEKHSRMRMSLYKKIIQVPNKYIFDSTTVGKFEPSFKALEGIKEETPREKLMDLLRGAGTD